VAREKEGKNLFVLCPLKDMEWIKVARLAHVMPLEHNQSLLKICAWFHWHSVMFQRVGLKALSFNFWLVTGFWGKNLLELVNLSISI
jgi:hypothetical protein